MKKNNKSEYYTGGETKMISESYIKDLLLSMGYIKKNHIYEKFHISPVIARIIRNRDVIGDEDIYNYLNGDLEKISSPWLFKDMDKAVDILRIKISHESKIRIICDYDVDGITSGYILFRSLKKLGANIDLVVPHRIEDGYGINEKLIKNAYDSGIDTILTCDNGISAYNQVEYAKSLGMNIIITDHHEVPFEETDGKRWRLHRDRGRRAAFLVRIGRYIVELWSADTGSKRKGIVFSGSSGSRTGTLGR